MNITGYKQSLILQRWDYLYRLGDDSEIKVAGFFNSLQIGVCAGNVILAMIISSSTLMEILKCKYRFCPNTFYDEMQLVKDNLWQSGVCQYPKNINISTILIKGICETSENQTYQSGYGPVGDQCLYKAYKNNLEFNLQMSPLLFEFLIRQLITVKPSSLNRFHDILTDIMEPNYQLISQPEYQYYYYPQLNILNVEFKLTHTQFDYLEPKILKDTYYEDIGKEIIDEIRSKMIENHIVPQVIHMGFFGSSHIRFHEKTFLNFVELLNMILRKEVHFIRPPRFGVYLYRQLFAVPKLKKEGMFYPFPVGGRDEWYELKAISFRLYNEINFLMIGRPLDLVNVSDPNIVNCVQRFKNKTISLRQPADEEFLTLIREYFKVFSKHFSALCKVVIENHEGIPREITSMHTFSIIFKDKKWWMMNDQYSFLIDDIHEFSELLSEEMIDAIILEKVKNPQLSSYL